MGKQIIGFIGQGFVGKHLADDYGNRGYESIRYSLEPEYVGNKAKLAGCMIVFIAVPTPTTPDGFSLDIVESALAEVAEGATAVIKSTILPGSTQKLQAKFPKLFVMHAPEFLREKTAAEDTARPERNIIGIPKDTEEFRQKAQAVLDSLAPAPYNLITSAESAECIKYIGNTFLYTKLVFMNMAYDFVATAGADWQHVREAVVHDSRIGTSHTSPVDEFGDRGAGGHCFIKDYEAFIEFFRSSAHPDAKTLAALEQYRAKNNSLLISSNKDLDLLHGVYGDDIPQ